MCCVTFQARLPIGKWVLVCHPEHFIHKDPVQSQVIMIGQTASWTSFQDITWQISMISRQLTGFAGLQSTQLAAWLKQVKEMIAWQILFTVLGRNQWGVGVASGVLAGVSSGASGGIPARSGMLITPQLSNPVLQALRQTSGVMVIIGKAANLWWISGSCNEAELRMKLELSWCFTTRVLMDVSRHLIRVLLVFVTLHLPE